MSRCDDDILAKYKGDVAQSYSLEACLPLPVKYRIQTRKATHRQTKVDVQNEYLLALYLQYMYIYTCPATCSSKYERQYGAVISKINNTMFI